MAKKTLSTLLKETRKRAKRLRDKVNTLKAEQQKRKKETVKLTKEIESVKKKQSEHVIVEFSMTSVAKATLVIIGLLVLAWLLYETRQILILFFVALFFAAALDGVVDQLEEKKIPRSISILGIYILTLGVLIGFVSTLAPLIASQTLELALNIRDLITNLVQGDKLWSLPFTEKLQQITVDFLADADQETLINNLQGALEQVGAQLQNITGNTFAAIKSLFDGLFNLLLVMVLTFFMVVDEKAIEAFFISLFPSRHGRYIIAKTEAVKEKFGYWLRGQIKLMCAMTVLTYIVLSILGVDYALTLAILAGLTELLPVVGPLIAAAPALLIGLNESLMFAFWILIAYIIIQQIEGNILVPWIMNKAVGLSPLVIIVVMLIGYQFLGIMGIIISVPLATAISIFINDYARREK